MLDPLDPLPILDPLDLLDPLHGSCPILRFPLRSLPLLHSRPTFQVAQEWGGNGMLDSLLKGWTMSMRVRLLLLPTARITQDHPATTTALYITLMYMRT